MTRTVASNRLALSFFAAIFFLAYYGEFIAVATAAEPSIVSEQRDSQVESNQIEEIIVRARKRTEILQEVGIAVSVINGDTLKQLRFDDARDLVLQIPSLQVQTTFGMSNPAVFLRGVGVNDVSAIASGTVGFYVDGVYIGTPAGQLFQFFDLERVEVLRGPQGTLYGRNTPAGAINFLSRDPNQVRDGSVRVSYGRFNERSVEGAVGGALSDKVSTRVAFVSNKRDGYVRNRFLGTDDTDIDNWAARASLDLQPNESVDLLFRLHAGRSNAGSRRNKSQGVIDPASVAAGMPAPCTTVDQIGTCSDPFGYVDDPDPFVGNWNRVGDEDVDYAGVSATLTWNLPTFTIDSVSAYSDAGRFILQDADGSPNQLLEIDWEDDSREWSQELRFSSQPGRALDWIAGLYLFDRDVRVAQVNDALRSLRPQVGFNPALGVFTVKTDFDASISAQAVFGQVDFELGKNSKIVAGVRYTTEEHRIDRFDRIEEPTLVIGLVNIQDRADFDDLSGKLGYEYTTQADNLFHASISQGFKSGGFNGSAAFDPESIPPFAEETVLSYEAGFKWTSPDKRLVVNTTGFYYDYRDLQVFTRANTGGIPREILTNAADARVSGLEIEILASIQAWDLQLSVGLLDTELEDFQTFDGIDFSGNELVYAPDTTLSGLVQRNWRVGTGRLTAQTDFHYQDDVFFDTSNNPLLTQDAYWIWNGRVSYRPGDGPWEFAIWGENLGDEVYKVAVVALSDFGFNNVTFSEPRTWGLELSWDL